MISDMSMDTMQIKCQGHKHIWKGFLHDIDCTLTIYLIDNCDGTQTLLILCDHPDKLNNEYSIDRMTLIFTTAELQQHIDKGTMIDAVIECYLREEATTRQIYGLTLH